MKNIQKQQFVKIAGILLFAVSASVVTGQPYQNGEFKAKNNTYSCKIGEIVPLPRNFYLKSDDKYYQFFNTKNVLRDQESGLLAKEVVLPKIDSERKFFELLCEVYGGKEKMEAMGPEKIHINCWIGMDHIVKEVKITVKTPEKPITTIFQVEAIENLVKERIRFDFDRECFVYRYAIYTKQETKYYTISEIPKLLEEMKQ